jgi:REP element-mobilizing transposase RayT
MPAYDYSESGAYFITAVTEGRGAVFGEILDAEMRLNRNGVIVERCWYDLLDHYAHLTLDEFVVMPNRVHGVISLADVARAGLEPAPTIETARRHGLSEIVRAFKTFSARRINEVRGTPGTPVWQRNYYERVVRNERELHAVREYIRANPLNWYLDKENPMRAT